VISLIVADRAGKRASRGAYLQYETRAIWS